jgi:two-component system sensor histidine kinase KdpD
MKTMADEGRMICDSVRRRNRRARGKIIAMTSLRHGRDDRPEAKVASHEPARSAAVSISRYAAKALERARVTLLALPGGRVMLNVLGAPKTRRFLAALWLMIGATLLAFVWQTFLGSRNLALLFIIATAVAGAWLGVLPALIAALAAFLLYNFFLVDPRFALGFAAADALALLTFLGSALAVGWLSGRLNERARIATERLNSLTTLFETSRDLSAATEAREVASRLVNHLTRARFEGAAIWRWREGKARLLMSEMADEAWAQEAVGAVTSFLASDLMTQRAGNVTFHRLRGVHGTIGAAALWGESSEETDQMWTKAMLELGAAAMDRDRLMAQVAQAELVAEREGLRTALLSSLSHDLRTPIATILASASGLQEHDARFDDATRMELVQAVQDEAERLNRYVTHLLAMTRLESGMLDTQPVAVDPREVIAAAVDHMRQRLSGRTVRQQFPRDAAFARLDPLLLEQALLNVLENAVGHTDIGGLIEVGYRVHGGLLTIHVQDDGPGIPQEELGHVFDKFFRGRSDRRKAAGVGLGLSVTKGLVEALEGRVAVFSPADQDRGTRFELQFQTVAAPELIDV